MANLHQRRGDTDKAIAQLEEAYQLDGTSVIVINNLAAILIDHFPTEQNLRRVQKMTQGFEDSNSAPQLDTLG
ncbi:MAG: hypothetical protein V7746_12810 [Halioglobus sp.]